jgi:hypothetical protein
MRRRSFLARVVPALAAACVLAVGVRASGPATSKQEAESARKKLLSIAAAAEGAARAAPPARPPAPRPARRTTLTENELNSYLAFDSAPLVPPGVADPSVTMVGSGRVSGRAVVDLDAVRKANPPTSLFDPRTLLRGQLPVTLSGTLRTHEGAAQFDLESATIGGVPVPRVLLQEIVGYYSKTPDSPSGFRLDASFQLPAGIREIQVEPGQAVVVQ